MLQCLQWFCRTNRYSYFAGATSIHISNCQSWCGVSHVAFCSWAWRFPMNTPRFVCELHWLGKQIRRYGCQLGGQIPWLVCHHRRPTDQTLWCCPGEWTLNYYEQGCGASVWNSIHKTLTCFRQIPPNTHWCGNWRPWWFFLRENRLSSTSTVVLGPTVAIGFARRSAAQISRM